MEDMKSLKRTRGGRERVLAAAAELFGARSLAGTSLQMIADRLGTSKPAIYHHFRSRDDIVAALMEPVVAEARAALDANRNTASDARVAQTRAFYHAFLVRHRKVINMVFFDRAAIPGDLPQVIDDLVDDVAFNLADGHSDAARARGMILVYGMAAYVARNPTMSDSDITRILNDFDLPSHT